MFQCITACLNLDEFLIAPHFQAAAAEAAAADARRKAEEEKSKVQTPVS